MYTCLIKGLFGLTYLILSTDISSVRLFSYTDKSKNKSSENKSKFLINTDKAVF